MGWWVGLVVVNEETRVLVSPLCVFAECLHPSAALGQPGKGSLTHQSRRQSGSAHCQGCVGIYLGGATTLNVGKDLQMRNQEIKVR